MRKRKRTYDADPGLQVSRHVEASEEAAFWGVVELHLVQLEDGRRQLLKVIRKPADTQQTCKTRMPITLPKGIHLQVHTTREARYDAGVKASYLNDTSLSFSRGFSGGLNTRTQKTHLSF